jgi:hypothetical protein
MKHYSLFVIGSNPEIQLQPFGDKQLVDVPEREIKKFRDRYHNSVFGSGCGAVIGADLDTRRLYGLVGKEYNKNAWIFDEATKKFNTKAKDPSSRSRWISYLIGGTYSDRLLLKNGRRSDQAYNQDIDWSSLHMAGSELERYIKHWDVLMGKAEPDCDEELEHTPHEYKRMYGDAETYARVMASFHTDSVLENGEWYEKINPAQQGVACTLHDHNGFAWEEGYFKRFVGGLKGADLITMIDCQA